jgi:oxygen-independent coproporphyrinogen III oxidase
MAGVYLHIPFCRKACTYCDFHFSTNLSKQSEMLSALQAELQMQATYFPANTILETIYFGGGTPSVLSAAQIATLLHAISAQYSLSPDIEITLEANPDDLSLTYLQEIRAAGINRLSIGIQSFRSADMAFMNRSHSVEQSHNCLKWAAEAGFENISADLMFGLPGMDQPVWQEQIQLMMDSPITHLSVYALTIEEKTALHKLVRDQKIVLPDDDSFGDQFDLAHNTLTANGWDHYEVSNYARNTNLRSQHNSAYWKNKPYLGLGPSAHSYNGKQRHWNVSHNAQYLQAIQDQKSPIQETETLTKNDQYIEYLMTNLRKVEGINLEVIQKTWGIDLLKTHPEILLMLNEGLLQQTGKQLSCTLQGWMISDELIRELI